MKIWITGGAGFLGQRLSNAFTASQHEVVSLSRRQSPAATTSIEIDLATEKDRITSLLDEDGPPDVVIHAASRQPGRATFPEFVKGNILTTKNLIAALQESAPKQIIFTSTLSVYAQSAQLPFTERHPPSSSLAYAATKRWAEQIMETFTESKVTVLRIPSLYGAGQGDSFIDGLARLAQQNKNLELFQQGKVIRDALHVSDVIRAIESCIAQPPEKPYCLMNLGTGRPISTLEYAESLIAALGSTSQIVLSEKPALQFDCYADIGLAREVIGFQPTELRESLRLYADELQA